MSDSLMLKAGAVALAAMAVIGVGSYHVGTQRDAQAPPCVQRIDATCAPVLQPERAGARSWNPIRKLGDTTARGIGEVLDDPDAWLAAHPDMR